MRQKEQKNFHFIYHRFYQRRSNVFLLAVFCLTLISYALPAAYAQSNIERRLEKKQSSPDEQPPAGGTGRHVRRKEYKPVRAVPRAPEIEVTFVADAAGASVLVDKNKIGETDRDGKLVAKVRAGRRVIVAQHSGWQTKPQNVVVNNTTKRFNFTLTDQAALQPAETNPANDSARDSTRSRSERETKETSSRAASATDNVGDDAEAILQRFRSSQDQSSVTFNEWQKVRLQAAQALTQDPSNAKAKALALFTEGQLAFLRKDYATAVVRFTSAIKTLPSSDIAYYGLGNAYLMTNQAGEAVRAYERAIDLNKDFALAYRAKGDALTRLGKNDESLKEYTRARSLGYSAPDVHTQVARALMRKRRWADALNELQPLAKGEGSGQAEIFLLMGECYQGLKQNVSALEAYRQAIRLDGRSASAFYKQGEVMYAEREYQAAAESLERALALDPSGTYLNRAQARKMANEATHKAGKNSKPATDGADPAGVSTRLNQ